MRRLARALRESHFTKKHQELGQSLVEFTLMTIFLLVLLMGILDLGRAYFTYLALKDSAAEGAYFGSAYPQCVDDNGIDNFDRDGDATPEAPSQACAGANNIPYRTRESAPTGGLVDWTLATIDITLPRSNNPFTMTAGDYITVTVGYRYQMLTPFVGAIANGQFLTLTAQSAATIIRVPNCEEATTCQ